ncbi:MAG TPA: 2-dehydro-3-deoxygalactonokinase [Candidatus Eisenbacteria bacterium]|nr:2-dehydro-3-deoxygalactonokinase [Candidatus Eisenbacteria bacterium]
MAQAEDARLIGLDWGTSSLRAYLFGDAGEVLGEKSAPSGVMHLERFRTEDRSDAPRETLFEAALKDLCHDWFGECVRRLPVIACGMIGSTVGWKEAAYLKAPVGTGELAQALTAAKRIDGTAVHIVPGICSTGEPGKMLPEILRGEETQVAGILANSDVRGDGGGGDLLIGLPGTHSKWVVVAGKRIVSFTTFVTGELYALLTSHSVIAKTEKWSEAMDQESFGIGLQLARRRDAEATGGILSTIFSTRSKQVLGELKKEQQPDYLSGLLIGEEVTGVERILARDRRSFTDFSRILLAGNGDLCTRYRAGCRELSWPVPEIVGDATQRGLWSIAREAGLLS